MPDAAPPDPVTESWYTDNVRQQVVTQCTSATRPTGVQGRIIAETDTGRWLYYDGTGWIIAYEPWQSWTPTWTNVTVGDGTHASYYQRSNGRLFFKAKFTLGSTSAITGTITLTVPVAASVTDDLSGFDVTLSDTGTQTYLAKTLGASTTTTAIYAQNASGTYLTPTATSSTVPHTWANTDIISLSGVYRMTTVYS